MSGEKLQRVKNLIKIEAKKNHIEKQIQALENNEKVVAKIGSLVSVNKKHEIDFQKNRLAYLKNLEGMTLQHLNLI